MGSESMECDEKRENMGIREFYSSESRMKTDL